MLVPDPDMVGGERVKIVDFGIAKVADGEGRGRVETRTGVIMGSPAYMSPEQCRNVSEVDDRSDVYALGILLYEMLAGCLPFFAESDAELMALHMYAVAAPLTSLGLGISAELSALVTLLLAKQPAQRPSMVQVLSRLNQLGGFVTSAAMPIAKLPPRSGPIDTDVFPTTLSSSAGVRTAGPRRLWLGIGASVMLSALLVVLAWQFALFPSRAARPAAAQWTITSVPDGAQVVKAGDGSVLGLTPLTINLAPGSAPSQFTVRAPGFEPQTLALDRAAGGTKHVVLASSAPAAAPAEAAPAAAASDASAADKKPVGGDKPKLDKRTGRPARIRNADIQLIQ